MCSIQGDFSVNVSLFSIPAHTFLDNLSIDTLANFQEKIIIFDQVGAQKLEAIVQVFYGISVP